MRVYFSGIGGVAIGPLAEIAIDAGFDVCGSDKEPGLMTDHLKTRNVEISFDQSGEFLKNEHQKASFDLFVYTAALPNDHPELTAAKELNIAISKRDGFLAKLIQEKNLHLVAVSGTHGKTSTTGLFVWILNQLGIASSYSVGSTLSFGPSGKFVSDSKYFIYECDEFDKNFLHFKPWLSLITAIDYDHPDTYPTKADYNSAFRQFITQSRQVIIWQKDASYIDCSDKNADILTDQDLTKVNLAGHHNRQNASLVIEALNKMGLYKKNEAQIEQALKSFPGTGRRFEKISDGLYSDYGHHPIEIKATLQMAKELSREVVLVYQPHQNVRQHEIYQQYTDEIFANADQIYWLPTYLTREDSSLNILQPKELTSNIISQDKIKYAELNDALWKNITEQLIMNKLVLCMGAGTIDGWLRQKAKNLHQKT